MTLGNESNLVGCRDAVQLPSRLEISRLLSSGREGEEGEMQESGREGEDREVQESGRAGGRAEGDSGGTVLHCEVLRSVAAGHQWIPWGGGESML